MESPVNASFEELVLSFGCNGPHRSAEYSALVEKIQEVNQELEQVRLENTKMEKELHPLNKRGCM